MYLAPHFFNVANAALAERGRRYSYSYSEFFPLINVFSRPDLSLFNL